MSLALVIRPRRPGERHMIWRQIVMTTKWRTFTCAAGGRRSLSRLGRVLRELGDPIQSGVACLWAIHSTQACNGNTARQATHSLSRTCGGLNSHARERRHAVTGNGRQSADGLCARRSTVLSLSRSPTRPSCPLQNRWSSNLPRQLSSRSPPSPSRGLLFCLVCKVLVVSAYVRTIGHASAWQRFNLVVSRDVHMRCHFNQ